MNDRAPENSETTIFIGESDDNTAVAAMVISGCAICLVAISLILLILYMMNKRSTEKVTLENREEEQIIRNYRK